MGKVEMRGNIDSIGDMFALTTAKYPTKTALIFQDERFFDLIRHSFCMAEL
jgi:hypothetical protein